jgi:hypothetical protein
MTRQHPSNIICHIILHNNKTLNNLSHTYDIYLKFHFYLCVLRDEMNKTRYHLHMYLKKLKLTHRYFKSSPSICSNWIDYVYFLHFWPSKNCISLTRLSSGRHYHAAAPCHPSFPWSQDELIASDSSSGNALSRRIPSRAETEALNLHHRYRPPSLDSPTPTLHCYKKASQP